jgi:hypothetical protein
MSRFRFTVRQLALLAVAVALPATAARLFYEGTRTTRFPDDDYWHGFPEFFKAMIAALAVECLIIAWPWLWLWAGRPRPTEEPDDESVS